MNLYTKIPEPPITYKRLVPFALLFSAFLIYSGVSVCSKLTSQQTMMSTAFFAYMGLELFFLACYALVWQQALKSFSLIFSMSCKGIVVILSLIWAVTLFHEVITLKQIIGSLMILFGIYWVAQDE